MSKWVEEVYEDDFDAALEDHHLSFVDFYADWCGPCKAVAPMVERTAKTFVGRIAFFKLNTDGNPAIASRYAVRSVPTMILFSGGKPVMRTGGYQPDAALVARLAPHAPALNAKAEPAHTGSMLGRFLGKRR
jgi:thioredoxin